MGSQPLDPDTGKMSGIACPKSSAQPWSKQLPSGAHGVDLGNSKARKGEGGLKEPWEGSHPTR